MNIDYTEGDYRKIFWSPYQEFAERVGESFELVKVLPGEAEDCDGEPYDMYRIKFQDGTEITAWPEEVFNGTIDGKPNP